MTRPTRKELLEAYSEYDRDFLYDETLALLLYIERVEAELIESRAEVHELRAKIEQLEKDNFSLAAGLCVYRPYIGEDKEVHCPIQDELNQVHAENERLKDDSH